MRKTPALALLMLAASGALVACTSSTGGAQFSAAQSSPQSEPQSAETPQSAPAPEPAGYVDPEQWWEQMSEHERAASVLMLHYPGTDAEATARFVEEFAPAGMILMGDNIPEDEASLTETVPSWANRGDLPLLVGIDQEGGVVSRVGGDPGRPAVELRDGDPSITEESFAARSQYLKSLGINTNFGVIADTTSDQESFIWTRVLGSTPEAAAEQVTAAVEGEAGIVYSAIKHFPGHGATVEDSHTTIPQAEENLEEWQAGPAVPFIAGVDAGVDMVMMGHLAFPNIAPEPASISPQWHRILREDLGFSGIIITDDMKMLRSTNQEEYAEATANAVAALNAGSTLILDIGGDGTAEASEFAQSLIDGLVLSVRNGTLDEETLKAASLKVTEARASLRDG